MFHCLVIKVLCSPSFDSSFSLSQSFLFVKNFFKFFQLLFLKLSHFFLSVFRRRSCSLMSCNFYILSHIFHLVKNFFFSLKIFFPISFKSMCSHVQRMLSYHRLLLSSRVFLYFFIFYFLFQR